MISKGNTDWVAMAVVAVVLFVLIRGFDTDQLMGR
jgi:hypothetical protein